MEDESRDGEVLEIFSACCVYTVVPLNHDMMMRGRSTS